MRRVYAMCVFFLYIQSRIFSIRINRFCTTRGERFNLWLRAEKKILHEVAKHLTQCEAEFVKCPRQEPVLAKKEIHQLLYKTLA